MAKRIGIILDFAQIASEQLQQALVRAYDHDYEMLSELLLENADGIVDD